MKFSDRCHAHVNPLCPLVPLMSKQLHARELMTSFTRERSHVTSAILLASVFGVEGVGTRLTNIYCNVRDNVLFNVLTLIRVKL